jgi:hypothetical protein
MQEKINRITSLIEKFLEENLTQEEEKELNAWLAEAEHNRLFFQQITNKEILREKLKLYAEPIANPSGTKPCKKLTAASLSIFILKRKHSGYHMAKSPQPLPLFFSSLPVRGIILVKHLRNKLPKQKTTLLFLLKASLYPVAKRLY